LAGTPPAAVATERPAFAAKPTNKPAVGTPQFRTQLIRKLKNLFPELEVVFFGEDGSPVRFQMIDAHGRPHSSIVKIHRNLPGVLGRANLLHLVQREEDFWPLLARHVTIALRESPDPMLRFHWIDDFTPDLPPEQTTSGVIRGTAWVDAATPYQMTVVLDPENFDAYARRRMRGLLPTAPARQWLEFDKAAQTVEIRLDRRH
jgi:hypothetical protein